MTESTCLHCKAATRNPGLCKRSRTTAKVGLENLASYHTDLLSLGAQRQVIRAKSSGVPDPTWSAVSRDKTEKSPADQAAADIRAELVGWVRCLLDDCEDLTTPRDTVKALAHFLGRHLGEISQQEWAGEFVRAIVVLEQRIRRIVERGRGRWYAGICSAVIRPEMPHDGQTCGCLCHTDPHMTCDVPGGCNPELVVIEAEYCDRELYAIPGTSYLRCPTCRTSHSVTERRAVLLEEAAETLMPLSGISRSLVALLDEEPSVQRLHNRLEKWVTRGDLVWSGNEGATRLYRVGDVLDLLVRHAADPRGWTARKAVV